MPVVKKDTWITEFLGKPAYSVDTGEMERLGNEFFFQQLGVFLNESGIKFLYAKISAQSVSVVTELENLGFKLVDTNITFKKKLNHHHSASAKTSEFEVRIAKSSDCESVMKIANQSFVYSRFHLDPNIDNQVANRIKQEWVANYFKGARGERMVVAEVQNRIAGFVQILERSDTFIIDLIAVNPEFQKMGVARSMIEFCFDYYKDFDYGVVGTQVCNIPSINLYIKCGYQFDDSKYIMHYHGQ